MSEGSKASQDLAANALLLHELRKQNRTLQAIHWSLLVISGLLGAAVGLLLLIAQRI